MAEPHNVPTLDNALYREHLAGRSKLGNCN